MTLLGWSALSSLVLEASAQSNSLIEALSYMNMSISVFAVATALIQLAGQCPGKEAGFFRKRCLGGTFRCARGRVMFEADARASTHVDFRA